MVMAVANKPSALRAALQSEYASLGGNLVLGAIVGILGGLGMKMHDRLIAGYTSAQQAANKDTTIHTAKEFYRCFLAFMIIGISLVGAILITKIFTNKLHSRESTVFVSMLLNCTLAAFALIQGALGVAVYKNLTGPYTDAQKSKIPQSTTDIYRTFTALMVVGVVILAVLYVLGRGKSYNYL